MLKRRWLLIGVVVGISALIDLVVLSQFGPRRVPVWFELLMLSMALSHGSLLGLWAALGGKATPWRFVAAFVAVEACIWWLDDQALRFWAVVLWAQMVAMSALLLLARLLGLELADDFRPDPAEDFSAQNQWVQYSIRSLLSWTAACAALLGAIHYLPKEPLSQFSADPAILVAIIGSSVVIGLGALWIGLGARWPAVRLVSLGVTAAAGVTTLWLVIGGTGELWEFVSFCLFQAAYLVGSLWLVRLAGYRLVWRRRVRL